MIETERVYEMALRHNDLFIYHRNVCHLGVVCGGSHEIIVFHGTMYTGLVCA